MDDLFVGRLEGVHACNYIRYSRDPFVEALDFVALVEFFNYLLELLVDGPHFRLDHRRAGMLVDQRQRVALLRGVARARHFDGALAGLIL